MSFRPSRLATIPNYDLDNRMFMDNEQPATRLTSIRRYEFMTEAEEPESVTPFLAIAMENDRNRRNYTIEPGGALKFHDNNPPRLYLHQPEVKAPQSVPSLGEGYRGMSLSGGQFELPDYDRTPLEPGSSS